MSNVLTRVVQTCFACPSQWDAWTAEGQYLYLRYRSGIGTVQEQLDTDTWRTIVRFGEPSMDGVISLEDFLARSGLELASGADMNSVY